MEDDFLEDPFGNLPKEKKEKKGDDLPVTQESSNAIANQLSNAITPDQQKQLDSYMDKMRWGITGVSALTCKDEECPYYTKCPLVRAGVPRPVDEDCPVEKALMDQWLAQFIEQSGVELEDLTAYDMLIIQDIAYQQLLEARAAMELADNPQIQVRTFMGFDAEGNAVSTYSLNNLVTFREKSSKMKMKLLREMIATAKTKAEEERGRTDRSSETADRLKRIEEKLGKDAIKKSSEIIDADFKQKK